MTIDGFQKKIKEIYLKKDTERGIEGTFTWFVEEIGELARAVRNGQNVKEELADCAAWLFSIANITNISMEDAVGKYKNECPKCRKIPCICD